MSTNTMSNKEKAALDKLKSWKPSAWSRSTEGAEPMDYRKLVELAQSVAPDDVSGKAVPLSTRRFTAKVTRVDPTFCGKVDDDIDFDPPLPKKFAKINVLLSQRTEFERTTRKDGRGLPIWRVRQFRAMAS